jgi:transcription antitermination factor NusG
LAHAYTPGLRVARKTTIKVDRILPLKGEVLVEKGQRLKADEIVAKTDLPGGVQTVNVVNVLGITPDEIHEYMLKKEGDKVKKDEPIAENKPFLGLGFLKTIIKSPIDGYIERISDTTGQVILREPPVPVQIHAYVDGVVDSVVPNEGVVMETNATFIQGIFGICGEANGELTIVADSPDQVLTEAMVKPEHKGKILVGGSLITAGAFAKARELGVSGIVAGGFHDKDLKDILGYDLGVAITGTETLGTTLVITEGFGEIPMAQKSFDLLKERAGQRASISGATQIRAGVIRPEIIIPFGQLDEGAQDIAKKERMGLQPGDPIRVIREPYFGEIGHVMSLPRQPTVVESETKVRVLEVDFGDGVGVVIPRANVEMIED